MSIQSQTKRIENKNSTATAETNKAFFQSSIVIIVTIIGGLTLFVSWISQNYFREVWRDERLYLEKTQYLIQIENVKSAIWQIQFNLEGQKIPQNKELYMSSAYGLIRAVTNILAWEEVRISDDSNNITPIEAKNFTQENARSLLDKGDLNGLIKLAAFAIVVNNRYQSQLDAKYFDKMANSEEKASAWNTGFLYCYVFGTLLLCVRSVLVNICLWPSMLCVKKNSQ